jgi:hypothetical protein
LVLKILNKQGRGREREREREREGEMLICIY